MSYLLDRRQKKKKIILGLALAFLLLVVFYFRSGVFGGLSYVIHVVFGPVLSLGDGVSERWSGMRALIADKNSLLEENKILMAKLEEQRTSLANYDSVLADKIRLEEILGRKEESGQFVLGAILVKPNRSPYDTLIIDRGEEHGIREGSLVFALGNVPIGRIAEIYPSTSKVTLFSTSSVKTEVIIEGQNAFAEIVGRGGGNFEMILPRDFTLGEGLEVVLPGIRPYVVASVKSIISDPRDAFSKALLVSPVNIYELKFVQIRK